MMMLWGLSAGQLVKDPEYRRNANRCIQRGGMCLTRNRTPDRKVHAGVIDRSELIHQFRPSWYCYEPEGIRCYLPIPLTPIRRI